MKRWELKLGLENDCTVEISLNPKNESRLKLNQDDFEQGRVLERVAQTPLVLGMSHGSDGNSDAQVHNGNSDV